MSGVDRHVHLAFVVHNGMYRYGVTVMQCLTMYLLPRHAWLLHWPSYQLFSGKRMNGAVVIKITELCYNVAMVHVFVFIFVYSLLLLVCVRRAHPMHCCQCMYLVDRLMQCFLQMLSTCTCLDWAHASVFPKANNCLYCFCATNFPTMCFHHNNAESINAGYWVQAIAGPAQVAWFVGHYFGLPLFSLIVIIPRLNN